VLIALVLAAQIGAGEAPVNAATAAFEQAPAKPKKAKEEKDAAAKPAKKPKKKKVAKENETAPDEPVDPAADAPAKGFRFSWKQHPSVRYADVFRLDVEG